MAESPPESPPKQPPQQPPQQPPGSPPEGVPLRPLIIQTQYVKDLSFENPNAPEIYEILTKQAPTITITLDVQPRKLAERTYEVVLCLRVQTKTPDKTAFLVELDYAGVVTIAESVPEDGIEPLLMVEAPRQFFPFARSIVAMITRDGSFPPLVINPFDFELFYAQHKKNALLAAQTQAQGQAQN